MRWAILGLITVHGLIHFLGVARAFGPVPGLTEAVSLRAAIGWGVAGVALIASGVLYVGAPRVWWVPGLASVVLSQALVVSAWSDAKAGTVLNALVLLLALHGLASRGPMSLRAEYEGSVAELERDSSGGGEREVVTEEDLDALPDPVARYLHVSGAVGRPRPTRFRAEWRGRIRAGPNEPWMDFTAEQHNRVDPPTRFFMMDARRAGLPVDVLHVFDHETATMRVRLLSVVPLVRADGPELTRAETVTILNDLALLAPGALLGPRLRWEAVDDRSARVEYTLGRNTVGALLRFDDSGDLVDFVSDDRLVASPDGSRFTPERWSTPLSGHRSFGPWRLLGHGEGRWHPEGAAPYAYIEMDLQDVEVTPGA